MAISYTWDCRTVETFPTRSDAQSPSNIEIDVIHQVHWNLIGTETRDGVEYSDNYIGTTTIDVTDLSEFTPFDSITNNDITAWVTGSISGAQLDQYKNAIKSKIDIQHTPVSITKYISN